MVFADVICIVRFPFIVILLSRCSKILKDIQRYTRIYTQIFKGIQWFSRIFNDFQGVSTHAKRISTPFSRDTQQERRNWFVRGLSVYVILNEISLCSGAKHANIELESVVCLASFLFGLVLCWIVGVRLKGGGLKNSGFFAFFIRDGFF